MLHGSCSPFLLHLPCFLPQKWSVYPCRHCSKTGLCSQLLSCPVEEALDTPKAQRSSTWKVMQVHFLQSSLGDTDLSAALHHALVIPEDCVSWFYQQNQETQSLTRSRRPWDVNP